MNTDKCEMYVLRQKLFCVSTHIVNLSYNGARRSDECVRELKYQMLPAASDGLLRHTDSGKDRMACTQSLCPTFLFYLTI